MPDLTEQHRLAQVAINSRVVAELARAWKLLDPTDLDGSFARYVVAALPILTRNRALSTAAAVAYLTQQRTEVLGDAGVLVPADSISVEQAVTVARVTSVVPIKKATALGVLLEQAVASAFVIASGDWGRLALDGGRSTIIDSAVAEPRVKGWERVVVGATCSFCTMLAGRGAVYTSSTVRFRAHGHCDCTAREVYRDA